MDRFSRMKFPILLYGLGLIVLALVFAASVAFGIPVADLTRDPVQTFGGKFYIGILSNMNIVVWGAGAFCALFCWVLFKNSGAEAEWVRFFKLGGFFTLLLMLDDLFMLHEQIFPDYLFLPAITGLRPNEKILIGLYGIFALWFFYSCRATIRKTPWHHLAVALSMMAVSLIIDRGIGKYIVPNKAAGQLVEDGAKLLGTIGWSWYFIQVGKTLLLERLNNTEPVRTAQN